MPPLSFPLVPSATLHAALLAVDCIVYLVFYVALIVATAAAGGQWGPLCCACVSLPAACIGSAVTYQSRQLSVVSTSSRSKDRCSHVVLLLPLLVHIAATLFLALSLQRNEVTVILLFLPFSGFVAGLRRRITLFVVCAVLFIVVAVLNALAGGGGGSGAVLANALHASLELSSSQWHQRCLEVAVSLSPLIGFTPASMALLYVLLVLREQTVAQQHLRSSNQAAPVPHTADPSPRTLNVVSSGSRHLPPPAVGPSDPAEESDQRRNTITTTGGDIPLLCTSASEMTLTSPRNRGSLFPSVAVVTTSPGGQRGEGNAVGVVASPFVVNPLKTGARQSLCESSWLEDIAVSPSISTSFQSRGGGGAPIRSSVTQQQMESFDVTGAWIVPPPHSASRRLTSHSSSSSVPGHRSSSTARANPVINNSGTPHQLPTMLQRFSSVETETHLSSISSSTASSVPATPVQHVMAYPVSGTRPSVAGGAKAVNARTGVLLFVHLSCGGGRAADESSHRGGISMIDAMDASVNAAVVLRSAVERVVLGQHKDQRPAVWMEPNNISSMICLVFGFSQKVSYHTAVHESSYHETEAMMHLDPVEHALHVITLLQNRVMTSSSPRTSSPALDCRPHHLATGLVQFRSVDWLDVGSQMSSSNEPWFHPPPAPVVAQEWKLGEALLERHVAIKSSEPLCDHAIACITMHSHLSRPAGIVLTPISTGQLVFQLQTSSILQEQSFGLGDDEWHLVLQRRDALQSASKPLLDAAERYQEGDVKGCCFVLETFLRKDHKKRLHRINDHDDEDLHGQSDDEIVAIATCFLKDVTTLMAECKRHPQPSLSLSA